MTDLLDELRTLDPEGRAEVAPPAEVRRRLLERTAPASRRGGHGRLGVGVAVVLLALCGGAAAAVFSLDGQSSEPASGPIPQAHVGDADRYRIAFAPDLRLGADGWCVRVSTSAKAERATLGAHCVAAPKAGTLLVDGGITLMSSDRALAFYVVDQRVAAVRLHDHRVVRAEADAELPGQVRLVAAIVPADAYRVDPGYLQVQALGVDGRPLVASTSDLKDLPAPPSLAPGQQPGKDAACELVAADGRLALSGTSVLSRASLRHATAAASLTCATATAHVGGTALRVAILASRSGAPSPPEAVLSDAAHGTRVQQSARRLDGGWLVVEGGTAAQRGEALAKVRAAVRS